jgi:hypothetical protein
VAVEVAAEAKAQAYTAALGIFKELSCLIIAVQELHKIYL